MKQSEFLAITFNLLKAAEKLEKLHVQGGIGVAIAIA